MLLLIFFYKHAQYLKFVTFLAIFLCIENDLKSRKIRFLKTTTTGELSKYFRKPGDPIFVRYDNHYSAPSLIPLEKCTDLFSKYEEKRSITRLYVSPEDFAQYRDRGRATPLRVEDSAGGLS